MVTGIVLTFLILLLFIRVSCISPIVTMSILPAGIWGVVTVFADWLRLLLDMIEGNRSVLLLGL